MAGAGITIAVDDTAFRRGLGLIATRLDDLFPVLDTLGAALAAETQDTFEREAGPDDTPWPQSLRAKLSGGQTLIDSGRLVQSISHQVAPDRTSVAVGTNVEYGAVHQFGHVIKPVTAQALRFVTAAGDTVFAKSVTIPARPFLGIGSRADAAIESVLGQWLAETAEGQPI